LSATLLAEQRNGDCYTEEEGAYRAGDLGFLPDSVQAGLVAVDVSQLEDCIDDIESFSCDVFERRVPATCKLAFTGLVAVNGACTINEDCAGDAFCEKLGSDPCPGTCSELKPETASCTEDAQCEDGLTCSARTGTCEVMGTQGDECGGSTDVPCKPGFLCDVGECVALASHYFLAADTDCDPLSEDERCMPGLVCESVSEQSDTGTCRPAVEAGATCKQSNPPQCPLSHYCDAVGAGETGTCVERPSDGEACLDGRTPACTVGHVCLDGTCVALKHPGDACEVDDECYGDFCADGTCAFGLQCELP
jgi:hypothetical protein